MQVVRNGLIAQHSAFYDEADLRAQVMRNLPLASPLLRPVGAEAGGAHGAHARAHSAAISGGAAASHKRERARNGHAESVAAARQAAGGNVVGGGGNSLGDLSGLAALLNPSASPGQGSGAVPPHFKATSNEGAHGLLPLQLPAGLVSTTSAEPAGAPAEARAAAAAAPFSAQLLPAALGTAPQALHVTRLPVRAALAMVAASCGDGITVIDGSSQQPLVRRRGLWTVGF